MEDNSMNIEPHIEAKLSTIGGEVKQLRDTIIGLEKSVTRQSTEVSEIHRLLLAFGDGLQPILQQFKHTWSPDVKKEHAADNDDNAQPRQRQRKLSQANLAAAKSYHAFPRCESPESFENECSQQRLTPSRSSPAFNTNISYSETSSSFLNVNNNEAQSGGLTIRNRTSSFCRPREKPVEHTRTRANSVSVFSIEKTKREPESHGEISRSSSLKKLSCESGIDIQDEQLFVNSDDEGECCDIVVQVPANENQECIYDKDDAVCTIQPDNMAEIERVSPNNSAGEKSLETGHLNSVHVSNISMQTNADEHTANGVVSQIDTIEQPTESLLAARIRKISQDKLKLQECIPGAESVTKAIEICDKNEVPSTTSPNHHQYKDTLATKCSSPTPSTHIQDFRVAEKTMTVSGNIQKVKILDTRTDLNKEITKQLSLSDIDHPEDENRDNSGVVLLKERVYSCSDLNQASSSGTLSCVINSGNKKMTRQHSVSSNASADSAPERIQIKLGHSESEGEETELEIKINPMPRPAFIHRVVQVKRTNSKYFYDLKEQVGGGRFGRVYRCSEKKTGLLLAAKCFKCKKPHETTGFKSRTLKRPVNNATKRTDQEPVDKEDVRHEISIMNSIDHENIIKLYDAFEYDNTMTLIMEYMDGGEMFERVLADRSQLTEFDAILYMRQICKAMQYLHKNLILHLDLKPENILCLDRDSHHIKIIDFGLSRKYNPRQKLLVHWGTPEFMAPEVLNYELVSAASDMWSVGVICYILVSGVSPFLGNNDKETIQNIIDSEWEFDDEDFEVVSADAQDFISRLLVEEKSGRMSAAQCLRHDWLSKPLTTNRHGCLQSKKQLKKFMARMHWKAGVAAVSAANWLFNKNTPIQSSRSTNVNGTSV